MSAVFSVEIARPIARPREGAITRSAISDSRLTDTAAAWAPESLLEPATALAQAQAPASALLAQALLTPAPQAGWRPEWRQLLVALRNHPRPAIRRRALDLVTSPEV